MGGRGAAGLAPHFTDDQLSVVYQNIFAALGQESQPKDVLSVYIQTLGALSKALGWRFGSQLDVAVPLVVRYCEVVGNAEDEFRENCLQALEAFVLKSPKEAKPFVEPILSLCIRGIQHDPNLADFMSEDGDRDDDDDDLSEEEYSDDEDVSWKVRRGAAKCISAILVSYPELLERIYPETCPLLVQRFKEREESVKCDVLATLGDLVRSVGIASQRSQGDSAGTTSLQLLQNDVEVIVTAAAKQLRDKSLKTKAGVFNVLKDLVLILSGVQWLTPALVEQLIPGVCSALKETSSNSSGLKIQALQFMSLSMAHSAPEVWQPHLPELAPLLGDAVAERYYKVTAEALRTLEQLVTVVRPSTSLPISAAMQGLVNPLFAAAASRVQAQDQDQEVKEAAMMAACKAIAVLGDALGPAVPPFLQVLLDKLRNEITRLAATRGITVVLESPLQLPLKPVIDPIMEQLTSFLRKYHRHLRYAALTAIQGVVEHHCEMVTDPVLRQAIVEVAPLINDNDLMLASSGLTVCRTLVLRRPDTASFMGDVILPNAVNIAGSAVIQGSALDAVRSFLVTLMQTGNPDVSFKVLHEALVTAGRATEIGKAAQISIASAVAAICTAAGPEQVALTVQSLLHEVKANKGNEVRLRLSLLTLGEIGRVVDLAGNPEVQPALTAALSASSEEIKAAASTALGAITLGNVNAYLPFLLSSIANKAADKYLLLKALNESIVQLAHAKNGSVQLDANHQAQILNLLLENLIGSDDEDPTPEDVQCRNVVAECLGHLALLQPPLLDQLLAQTQNGNGIMRQYIVRAIKATLVASPHPVDSYLKEMMPFLLSHLEDENRHVRKSAVELLNAAAHNKPGLVQEHLEVALPELYKQTDIDESLIKTVDLGPFKHKIDDGLELRKVAFECMDVIFGTCPGSIDYNAFMGPLNSGLGDQHDIKLGCHILLCKLASRAGAVVLANLDPLVIKLEDTLNHRVKQDAVKQEMDRNEDMLRSCLRAVEAVQNIPNSDACASFRSLIQNTVMKSLAGKFEAVKRERAEAEGKDKA